MSRIQIFQYIIYGIASFFFVYAIILLAEGFYTTSAIKKELQSDFKTTVCGRCITAFVREQNCLKPLIGVKQRQQVHGLQVSGPSSRDCAHRRIRGNDKHTLVISSELWHSSSFLARCRYPVTPEAQTKHFLSFSPVTFVLSHSSCSWPTSSLSPSSPSSASQRYPFSSSSTCGPRALPWDPRTPTSPLLTPSVWTSGSMVSYQRPFLQRLIQHQKNIRGFHISLAFIVANKAVLSNQLPSRGFETGNTHIGVSLLQIWTLSTFKCQQTDIKKNDYWNPDWISVKIHLSVVLECSNTRLWLHIWLSVWWPNVQYVTHIWGTAGPLAKQDEDRIMLHLAAVLYRTEILTPITGTHQIILSISGQVTANANHVYNDTIN